DYRTLNATERLVDRETVRRIADELFTLIAGCERFLVDEFEPALLNLERSVAEGDIGSLGYVKAASRFDDVLESWRDLHSQVRAKSDQLRTHENLVATPGGLTSG